MRTKPVFKHECKTCIYLKTMDINPYPPTGYGDEEYWVDFYVCLEKEKPNMITLIARDGNGPHEYEAITVPKKFVECYELSDLMGVCLSIAKQKGIL